MIETLSRRSVLMSAGGAFFASMLPRSHAQQTGRRWTYSISDFANCNSDGWLAGFSDFSLETASTNRIAEVRPLPQVIGENSYGYYLRSRNTSDDIFIFLKKPITGLEASRAYDVDFYKNSLRMHLQTVWGSGALQANPFGSRLVRTIRSR
jgi:hypothetical protein